MSKSSTNYIDKGRWGWLVLFTSLSTLICCALPILLVTLGLGAVSASLFSTFPVLVSITKHKLLIFAITSVLLGLSAWAIFRPNRACPSDPDLALICERSHRFNKRAWFTSVIVWLIGFSTAYLALPLFNWLSP